MKAAEISDYLHALAAIKHLPRLYKTPFWPRNRLESYQLEHLRKLLNLAHTQVPLYRDRALPDATDIRNLSDWSQVPLLTKQDLLARPVADRINSAFQINALVVSKSSGSSGQALDVYYDKESFYLFVMAGLRLYSLAFSYRPWHRQAYVYTSPYPANSFLGLYPLDFYSTLMPIPELLEALRKQPPQLLVCYPSHLRAIVDQMTDEDFKTLRPLAIKTNSEASSSAERKYLSEKLGSFVFDEYSSEELTRIAAECRNLNYHVFEDIVHLEIVDDQGQPVPDGVVGNIVGTNLHNVGMPLLRYMQGDRGALSHRRCECGRTFKILEKLEGRKNDAFVLPNGKTVSSGFLLDLTYGIFLDYEHAVQAFCLLQERPDVWTLEIVPGQRWNASLEQEIPQKLEQLLKQPEVRIEAKIVAQVTRTASGKANPIISRIKKG